MVSQVALAMFLDGDRKALKAYLAGERSSDLVRSYFDRLGLVCASGREGRAVPSVIIARPDVLFRPGSCWESGTDRRHGPNCET
jgi:hypothetical protein